MRSARGGGAPPQTRRAPERKRNVDKIEEEQSGGDRLVDGIVFPGLRHRENRAGKRQQLDARREPQRDRARGGQPQVRAQRVASGTVARQSPERRNFVGG